VSDGRITAISETITFIEGTDGEAPGGTLTPSVNKITISGITESSIKGKLAEIMLLNSLLDGASSVATGQGTISSGSPASLTVELKDASGYNWTGTGSFYIMFLVDEVSKGYAYTNGGAIPSNPSNLPKYTIASASTDIPFGKFKESEIEEHSEDSE
jgi:hypothetical protein